MRLASNIGGRPTRLPASTLTPPWRSSRRKVAMSLTSRLAARLPESAVMSAIHLAYQRAEPELRRLDDICGHGGVMVYVGAGYAPWSPKLAPPADPSTAPTPPPPPALLHPP